MKFTVTNTELAGMVASSLNLDAGEVKLNIDSKGVVEVDITRSLSSLSFQNEPVAVVPEVVEVPKVEVAEKAATTASAKAEPAKRAKTKAEIAAELVEAQPESPKVGDGEDDTEEGVPFFLSDDED